MARLFAVETPLPAAKPELQGRWPRGWCGDDRPGDWAQALMDLGATGLQSRSRRSACSVRSPPACRRAGVGRARDAIRGNRPRPRGRGAAGAALVAIEGRAGRAGPPARQGLAGRHAGPARPPTGPIDAAAAWSTGWTRGSARSSTSSPTSRWAWKVLGQGAWRPRADLDLPVEEARVVVADGVPQGAGRRLLDRLGPGEARKRDRRTPAVPFILVAPDRLLEPVVGLDAHLPRGIWYCCWTKGV